MTHGHMTGQSTGRTWSRRAFLGSTVLIPSIGLASCAEDSSDQSVEDYPSKDLDWTIAFGPGGGNDIMSRTIVDILESENLYPHDIIVQNREGGSGATGWGHVFRHAGNPYVISTTSGSFLTTPLESNTGWTYADFTPVALFATDAALLVVDSESGLATWDDWVRYATSKDAVAVGGIGTVNVDFIIHDLLAAEAGYHIDYVPFNDEGQLLTALTSKSLEAVVSNPGEVMGQIEAGDMTALLFTGSEPLPTLPDVPTGKSLGFDNLPTMPRGLILPPDVPEVARQWWISTMKKVIRVRKWRTYLRSNYLVEDVRWGDAFGAFLEQTSKELEAILRERGAI
ncbi:MAG TPA: tripartite tricarboxylate transporter substrate-binding protein [Actinopolymorphaceae bacterium]|jgi:tripartite-type tricarboxylate transporter receptor subunit TctC